MNIDQTGALLIIDRWFRKKCDGLWEHQHGVKITTTDNPGWLIEIDEAISEATIIGSAIALRERWGAECVRRSEKTIIYSESFAGCVCSLAFLLEISS